MALQNIYPPGIIIDSMNPYIGNSANASICDAAGESVTLIGTCVLEGGSGSKTISSAGGAIVFQTGTVTFANAGTNFRIGIQDVASTGLEDGTFDVYVDLTGGGGGLASNTWYEKAMTNGTKTISHGDIIAISMEMTSRGGTDSVAINNYAVQNAYTGNFNYPYRTVDTGAGPTRTTASVTGFMIIFDDGSLGWLNYGYRPPWTTATLSYNSGSTPDEYAAVFKVPYKCSVIGGWMVVGSIASTDNFEFVLYSDAEGTPTSLATATIVPAYTGATSANNLYSFSFASSNTLSPNKWYAISMRPTTTNTLSLIYVDFTSTFGSKYKKSLTFGSNCKLSSRTNQSGAFSEVQTYYHPIFGITLDKLDDGLGGGSWAYVG